MGGTVPIQAPRARPLRLDAWRGHFNPLVPLIEACRRRGDDVLVAGPPPLAGTVARAGYRFWPGEAPPEDELGAVWARVPTVSREEGTLLVVGEIFARLNVRAMLPAMSAACEEWRPELVLRDPSEFASAVAADQRGIAHARVGIGFAAVEGEMLATAGGVLEERWPGIAGRIAASPYLTAFPASLEDPRVAPRLRAHRFRDPAADDAPEPLPDWWPGDDRPLVYVTFGSVAAGIPLVVVPLFADQPENARRVAAVGAGIAVVPDAGAPSEAIRGAVDPAAVRDAVEAVLADGEYRGATGRLADEIRALPPADAALEAVLRYAAGSGA